MNLRSATVFVVCSTTLALAAGCTTTGEDPVDVEIGGEVAPASRTSTSGSRSFAEPVCPIDPSTAPPCSHPDPRVCPGRHEKWWYQVQATRVAWYLLGGTANPFDPEPVGPTGLVLSPYGKAGYAAPNDNPTCDAARECITNVRNAIMAGSVTVDHAGSGRACGLPAGLFTMHVTQMVSTEAYDAMGQCAAKLDACWGAGVSGFFFPGDPSERTIYIDPEPVITGGTLSGASGATAAATYVSSGVSTQIALWPDRYEPGTLPAGLPCSPVALRAGQTSDKIIYVNSLNKRKCM